MIFMFQGPIWVCCSRDHVEDEDDDNDGILDVNDEDDDGDGIPDTDVRPPLYHLKELYISILTLTQKLVLTLLNNEFILEILISTPFGRKIRERFRLKNHKSQISG